MCIASVEQDAEEPVAHHTHSLQTSIRVRSLRGCDLDDVCSDLRSDDECTVFDTVGLAGALVGVLEEAKQQVPSEIYKYPLITKKKQSKLYGAFGPKNELAGKTATKITFDE